MNRDTWGVSAWPTLISILSKELQSINSRQNLMLSSTIIERFTYITPPALSSRNNPCVSMAQRLEGFYFQVVGNFGLAREW